MIVLIPETLVKNACIAPETEGKQWKNLRVSAQNMAELGSSETEGGVSCFNSNNVMLWNYIYKIIRMIYSQLIQFSAKHRLGLHLQ